MSNWWEGIDPRLAWAGSVLLFVTNSAGFPIRVSSGYRSTAEQQRLWEEYLAGKRPGPVAKPGTSTHERGRAIDVVWVSTGRQEPFEGAWERLGSFAEQYLGLRWGGRWHPPDEVHFDLGLGSGS